MMGCPFFLSKEKAGSSRHRPNNMKEKKFQYKCGYLGPP